MHRPSHIMGRIIRVHGYIKERRGKVGSRKEWIRRKK